MKALNLDWGYRLMNVAKKEQGVNPTSIQSAFSPLFLLGWGDFIESPPPPHTESILYLSCTFRIQNLRNNCHHILPNTYRLPEAYSTCGCCPLRPRGLDSLLNVVETGGDWILWRNDTQEEQQYHPVSVWKPLTISESEEKHATIQWFFFISTRELPSVSPTCGELTSLPATLTVKGLK